MISQTKLPKLVSEVLMEEKRPSNGTPKVPRTSSIFSPTTAALHTWKERKINEVRVNTKHTNTRQLLVNRSRTFFSCVSSSNSEVTSINCRSIIGLSLGIVMVMRENWRKSVPLFTINRLSTYTKNNIFQYNSSQICLACMLGSHLNKFGYVVMST